MYESVMKMSAVSLLLLLVMTISGGQCRPSTRDRDATPAEDPLIPLPVHVGVFGPDYAGDLIAARIASWSPADVMNVWELSGLREGDIMEDGDKGRNAVRDPETLWSDATIPYIIDPTFTDKERKTIREGMDMIEKGSCFKFRPFRIGDFDFVLIQGASTGCWSYVGKQGGGQVVNLQHNGCVYSGVVAHEFLHAAGFFHQQSAHDRDKYVLINYNNIQSGRENNFEKYNDTIVTDYGVGYDYGSIMHYSRKAFSKNGEDTIVPLEEGAEIGNREKVSEKDLAKLSQKYGCKDGQSSGGTPSNPASTLMNLFGNLIFP